MFRWALIYLCFIEHYYVCWGQDRVEQPSGEMTENEGAQVILMCNYTTTNPDLFWYKQLPNRSPTFIQNQYTTEPDFKKRFSATLDSTSRTFPLTIKNLRVSDSAVYYCALSYSSAFRLHWYRHYPGSAPEFIVLISDGAKQAQESYVDSRFKTKVIKDKEPHVDLEISSASISDSALYYCALEPTVTGNTRTLYKNLTHFIASTSHMSMSSGQDRVEQSSEEITASERDQVIVRCNYFTTGINIYLFWYKQLPNKSPTFILNQYTTEPDFKKRFSATLNSTSRTFSLMIKNLLVSDSAVYYCALRPTVTKTHSTLIQKQRKCSVI
uniref:Ig-like domain-containing protein n=1 Tax=Sinocyclocheilus grahami TaxID=75366 RepID=A0A672PZZ8_SINGR